MMVDCAGAHTGRGLGRMFLRHLRRTRMLMHVVDCSMADPATDYYVVSVCECVPAFVSGLLHVLIAASTVHTRHSHRSQTPPEHPPSVVKRVQAGMLVCFQACRGPLPLVCQLPSTRKQAPELCLARASFPGCGSAMLIFATSPSRTLLGIL